MHKISPPKCRKWHLRDSTFQNFPGEHAPLTPLGVLARSVLVGRTDGRPPAPPNFVTPYAYGVLNAETMVHLYIGYSALLYMIGISYRTGGSSRRGSCLSWNCTVAGEWGKNANITTSYNVKRCVPVWVALRNLNRF